MKETFETNICTALTFKKDSLWLCVTEMWKSQQGWVLLENRYNKAGVDQQRGNLLDIMY